MKKQDVINLVEQSAGSLFTKEDVINLINKVEGENSVNFDELKGRIIAIIENADTSDIEPDKYRAEFRIANGNEVELEDVEFNVQHYVDAINHDIEELFESIQNKEEETAE